MLDRGEAVRKLVLNVARYSGLASFAGRLVGGVGAILMLHRVTDAPCAALGVNRHLAIKPEFLDALITDMKAHGYVFVTLDEAIERLRRGGGDRPFATITADDAYRDNLVEAFPVLERHDAPITIYVAPSLISGTVDLWWDLVEEIVAARDHLNLDTPRGRLRIDSSTALKKYEANVKLHTYLTTEVAEEDQHVVLRALAKSAGVDPERHARAVLMNWDEIRTSAAHPLVTIGAHTVNHYNLSRLSPDRALHEMAEAATLIQAQTGSKPRHMAYPYGYASAVGQREVDLSSKAGFVSAVTTRHGVLRPEHANHLHALPRISINGRYQKLAHVRTMLSGITTPIANSGKVVVTV